ncbi:type II toxin-antitoxin system PemK/MazF family toxin [Anaerococcus urinomassiliensis]|uniref:type II toxin-antitoxin system PemK/MazF family toxin n=1 Tax=Anaerococcus urinomassiliensis TaxID=1745712 RepID=UPI0009405B0E|nr:type II toxin-antitoxin system PemK/MazF family toxin [Anaerococcus urinomassiliensis]
MVDQGDIIKVNFNPQKGHEQAGYGPALIVSNNFFNEKTNLVIACPITNTDNNFPLHVRLDDRTETSGVILCEHMKTLDLKARGFKYVEKLPTDIFSKVVDVLYAQIEEV